ncbi:hypothetical protein SLNWT_2907 [Streptomyces albus]|uniref:Chitin-binding type-2 domain-containing protein n=1 Tax=Streptomyces albus (strain ATCC 21838 / DSM 41398 / FERM P-419 / JCM 4703 / NBRC 107858) TaxID=1081613 RepID=A0A0B5ELJ7_STRA4|nr:hypothetical protein SLNWT_2907 [Streptomyces albus]AOU77597.1 hypothetical protein SLNHY_2906 [Streptomyces albus]AYN33364.1 hypothetical protein DUI70_2863 [Streptomyces albus]
MTLRTTATALGAALLAASTATLASPADALARHSPAVAPASPAAAPASSAAPLAAAAAPVAPGAGGADPLPGPCLDGPATGADIRPDGAAPGWFYRCSGKTPYRKPCPAGLHWSGLLAACDRPARARYATDLETEPVHSVAAGPLRAHLTVEAEGTPIAHARITFTTPEGTPLCTARTTVNGEAACTPRTRLPGGRPLSRSFTATYAGNGAAEGSTAWGQAEG